MENSLLNSVKLNNGVEMPLLGLGTMSTNDNNKGKSAVKFAIETGYRSIDTAATYGTEAVVGEAIKESGVAREELFVTTKVLSSTYRNTLYTFEASLEKLGLDYLDLYLIHFPSNTSGELFDNWRALEKLYKDGLVRAIGVSNFHKHHLQPLIENSEIKPMVNQVERHLLLHQQELLAFCKQNDIVLEAWSPLMMGNMNHPLIVKLGEKYKKSPAQIILRWHVQSGVVAIPKSVTPSRLEENLNIFDFQLVEEDMQQIDALNENRRFGPNPDTIIY